MLQDELMALRGGGDAAEAEPVKIELVLTADLPPETVAAAVSAAVPETESRVETAFGGPTDRFHFVTFPGTASRGREAEVFAFARRLLAEIAPATGAVEANPVLTDSLVGAAAVAGPTTELAMVTCETPSDSSLPWGWVHGVIRTPPAWRHTRGAGVTVAVIDTGYSSHRELSGAILSAGQLNLIEGGTDARDRFSGGFLRHPGHGTLVCSVVASRGDADLSGQTSGPGGVTGSAPLADILPIRAIKSVITFQQDTLPRAIAHAVAAGAGVITMALGGPTRVASTERALRLAVAEGVVITCAAGNCWPKVVFPAAYAAQGLCTAVAALTRDLTPWRMSGRGPEVTIAAPGENVWGASKNAASDGDTGIKATQGTTLATSLTAGVAALWVAHHGGRAALKARADAAGTTVQAMWVDCLTRGLVRPAVWNGATDLGAGVLDAERTLAAPLPQGRSGSEAVADAALPPSGVDSTANVLMTHLINHDPAAAQEFGPDLVAFAPEILWLSHRTGARARALSNGAEAVVLGRDPRSPGLEAALAARPALRAATGGF
jgi:hypothetical protein